MKFLIILIIIVTSYSAFGSVRDTAAVDTVIVSPDKIQTVEIICNTTKIQANTEVINSQYEFNKFIGNSCHPSPDIDFSKQTLLYFPTKATGCKPDYVRTVKIAGNIVIYQVTVILHDECYMLQFANNCIAVPKIDSKCSVRFQKTETIKHDSK
jgi:hypothetical protein